MVSDAIETFLVAAADKRNAHSPVRIDCRPLPMCVLGTYLSALQLMPFFAKSVTASCWHSL